ncbi:MAG: glycyl-radical enzyme activating protein [Deltaproteobacteria bacterium]|nr:glycyl-radical enzyme activating protein [Deltaproteobacteria bacterium]
MAQKNPNATILEIQRMSTEDGPGIRTTIFFKGCSLNCSWCHNPESISPHPQIHWISNRCIGCKICLEVCSEGALTFTESSNRIDRNLCNGCGLCTEECPGDALALLGRSWELEDLFKEVIKDRAYFGNSGGGVTLGGGEPTLQAPFSRALLKKLKETGIHTALDTCGMCSDEAMEGLLPHTDLLLFDLKEIDTHKHERFTGIHNDKILKNLNRVGDHMRASGHPTELWIRTPIIPDATATDENIRGIGKFIAENLCGLVKRWELCAFNNLCKDKYSRLDLSWAYRNCALFSKLQMEKMAAVAGNSGVDPSIVLWSGSTKLEGERSQVKAQMGESV